MQRRMKTNENASAQRGSDGGTLAGGTVGTLAAVNEDGSPYTTPVHFVHQDAALHIHGLPAGKKPGNLKRAGAACFSIYRMDALLFSESGNPCNTNAGHQSLIIRGNASMLTDAEARARALDGIARRYTPHLSGASLPESMVRGTCAISVAISQMTGKYREQHCRTP